MSVLEFVLQGGVVAAAFIALVWIAKSWVVRWIERDLEEHKSALRVESEARLAEARAKLERDLEAYRSALASEREAAVARLTADLRVAAGMRERQFEVQHAKRTEALEGLYVRLRAIESGIRTFDLQCGVLTTLHEKGDDVRQRAKQCTGDEVHRVSTACIEYLVRPSVLHLDPAFWERVEGAVSRVNQATGSLPVHMLLTGDKDPLGVLANALGAVKAEHDEVKSLLSETRKQLGSLPDVSEDCEPPA